MYTEGNTVNSTIDNGNFDKRAITDKGPVMNTMSRTQSSQFRHSATRRLDDGRPVGPACYDVEPLIGGNTQNSNFKTPPRYSIPKSASGRYGGVKVTNGTASTKSHNRNSILAF